MTTETQLMIASSLAYAVVASAALREYRLKLLCGLTLNWSDTFPSVLQSPQLNWLMLAES